MNATEPILLFDGVCNLCNALVNFVLDHEANHSLHFAALDSPVGKRLLSEFQIPNDGAGTLVLIESGRCFTKSTGALHLAWHLRRPWRWLALLRFIPRPIRDWFYDWVAKNRYRWFGRTERCRIPEPGLASRFLN